MLCVFLLSLAQTETLSSLKALLKHIDQTQLTRNLEGTFHYDHNHWIHFRQVGVDGGGGGACRQHHKHTVFGSLLKSFVRVGLVFENSLAVSCLIP